MSDYREKKNNVYKIYTLSCDKNFQIETKLQFSVFHGDLHTDNDICIFNYSSLLDAVHELQSHECESAQPV